MLGVHDAGRSGPTLVVLSAVHGNEPAGVEAIERVLARLEERQSSFAGRLVGLVGNPSALACGRRFQRQDLNRLWSADSLAELAARDPALDGPEEHECRELFATLDAESSDPRRELILLDLHSTSAHGSPFTCISDALRSRELALALPVPLILGIEEAVKGSLLDYMEEQGRPAIAFEGGQHTDPATVDNHEAAIWLTLVAAGHVEERDVPELQAYRDRLSDAAAGSPALAEVTYRHPVREGDGFAMLPGFRNFEKIRRGQLLANDRGGPVGAPAGGLVLMPLYQGQGEDGFFIVRRVARAWLAVSRLFRHARAGWLLERLPGVRRIPQRPDLLVVNPVVARAFPVQLFHLAGYRRLPDADDRLMFSRRASASRRRD
jgi:succinylglutamate desuccinylase